MDYSSFKPEDFSRDPYFQKWVLTDDPKAAAFWKSWLKQHPDKYDEIAQAQEMIRLLGFQKSYDANEDYLEVWSGIQERLSEAPVSRSRSAFLKPVLKVAAAFAIIAVVTVLAFSLLRSFQTVTYTADFGKIRSVALPDGSKVTLNANSTLRVPKTWSYDRPREVWLEGEAFFEVEKVFENAATTNETSRGASVKFVVHTGLLDVEVLGTEFNVNNRHEETRVVLKSGKVKLSVKAGEKTEEVFMQPGDMVTYNELSNMLTKRIVNPDAHASWKDQRLVFEEATLSEVARTLEDLYGIKIQFEEPALAEEQFTGLIPYDDIHVIIEAFTKLYDIEITKNQNTIIFHKK